MAFQVSPGVEVNEIDLTNVVPAVSTSIGAYAGVFDWGPVEDIVTVGSEKGLRQSFAEPDSTTAPYFYPAAQFLQYSNTLRVVRAETTGMLNSTPDGAGLLIKNESDYDTKTFSSGQEFIAKYPGSKGNAITVAVASSATAFEATGFDEYRRLFDFAPGTTEYAEGRGVENDELHVIVIDRTGDITGTAGTVLETWQGLSQASDARTSAGASNYYRDVINSGSEYVWVGAASSNLSNSGDPTNSDQLTTDSSGTFYETFDSVERYDLSGGTTAISGGVDVADVMAAYDLFEDAETVDVNLIIGAPAAETDDVTLANYLIAIAEGRRDVVAFVSPAISRTVNNITATEDVIAWADQLTSSSYAVFDSTALYVYDKYNDVYRWVNAAGTVAGLCAFTDNVQDPWFSPAGFNRGQLRGVTRIAMNPKKAQRDDLYKARVNPIVAFPGQGIVLYGDKTALAKPSAFDRINVRRLFITLEKAISTAAKFQLFELNDEFTRAQFRNLVEPFLRDVQGRRGVTDFQVVCDDTNNTPEVIDSNRFVADIYIKPARSINFITLNFIAVRTGVEFSEIAGQ
jgi:phage tail sheath protein FI